MKTTDVHKEDGGGVVEFERCGYFTGTEPRRWRTALWKMYDPGFLELGPTVGNKNEDILASAALILFFK